MGADAEAPLLEGRRGATPAQTLGNIVVSIVGTGVLGLPYAFRTSGWLAGALGVAGAGAATFYCMLLLLDCRDKLREQEDEEVHHDGNYTYGDLGEKCFGRIGRYFTEVTIILSQTGGSVAYLVFIGQNVCSVFPAGGDERLPRLSPAAVVVLAVLLPAEAALSFIRSLSSLAPFSILADACTVLAVATVVKENLQLLAGRGGSPFDGRSAFAGLWGVPFACGVAVFCFEGFCLTLALEASMSDRRRFRPVLLLAIAGVTVVYVCFGVCGYLAYGDATRDIVTLNLPNNWSTAAVKIVLCVALALTFPMMMHPIHEIAEARLFPPGGWARKRGGGVERAAVRSSRVAVVAALSAVACFVPAFGEFASFVGSTVCAMLSFVLPALFHLRLVGAAASPWRRAVDGGFLLLGLGFAAHGLYTVVSGH
ncbi:amino acid transporter ANT1-like [Oryza brachyantha]|uniref:amino acid transporter ANT1-like n=1 Tax=Oryza brachyantha TaxID=4533 RepID=UPI001ADC5B80|nr:amino acid transporter ANT1-like [Oryza brachyantha]XP_040378259.1 amino acid transporter ANT1-like [Oryza brachyantha]